MLKKIAIGVGVAAIGLGAKFVLAPTLAVQAQNSLGVGWNDSKTELVAKFTEVLGKEFEPLGLSPADLSGITNCCADKAIAFLNKTDCSYQYNTTTTTEAEHLKEQEECMVRVKYEAEEEKIALACFKEKLPNDWKLLRSSLVQGFVQAVQADGVEAQKAQKLANCFADRAVQMANERKCQLINQQAATADDLFIDMSKCISDEESKKIGEACAEAP